MYCPTCGAEATPGLNYCKQCGASLGPTQVMPEPRNLAGLYWAIAVITVAGLALLSGTVLGVVGMGLNEADTIVPIIVFGCLMIFGVDAMLIRQLSRLVTMVERGGISHSKSRPQAPPRLTAPPIGMSSVTEHTTRQFARRRGDQSDEAE